MEQPALHPAFKKNKIWHDKILINLKLKLTFNILKYFAELF